MSNSDPKDKRKSDKQEKEKRVEKKPSTSNQPVPERPQPNVTRAQKSAGDVEDKSGNEDNG